MPPIKRHRDDSADGADGLLSDLSAAREKAADAMHALESLVLALESRMEELQEREERTRVVEAQMQRCRDSVPTVVNLSLRGKVFQTYRETLLRVKHTYFHTLFSSGAWMPNQDGAYFIDARYEGFERILNYLSSGNLSLKGLNEYEVECVYENLEYFQIPYTRVWDYSSCALVEGLQACALFELPGTASRLCCASDRHGIRVWDMSLQRVETTLEGHADAVVVVIPLHDGRICSGSLDCTIKIWNLDTRECVLSLDGHEKEVLALAQLADGRLCSGDKEGVIKVWNLDTGTTERSISNGYKLLSLLVLPDGRICCNGGNFVIKVWSILTGECEMTLEGHLGTVDFIISVDGARICSCSRDNSIRLWDIATGQCLRSLDGHTNGVRGAVLMRDGRLCSCSHDGTIRLWNLDTGVCEKTLVNAEPVFRVMQLRDGRLVSIDFDALLGVRIWS